MSEITLRDWILNNPNLQLQVEHLACSSVAKQFPTLVTQSFIVDYVYDWRRLLMAGSILAGDDRGTCQEVALRVASACLESSVTTELEKDAAAVILDMLSNKRAINLAIDRQLIEPHTNERLGIYGQTLWVRRSLEHSILIGDKPVTVNRFQNEFWNETEKDGWVSASAPTSAGKSFVLINWIVEQLVSSDSNTAVYLAPTRALVTEVEGALRKICKERGSSGIHIYSLPLGNLYRGNDKSIFVFTQERLHIFLSSLAQPPIIDLLVVDEAQKISEGQRGVLLEQSIEKVTSECSTRKVVFVSPLTLNPEVLMELAPTSATAETRQIKREDVTVNQNLIYAVSTSRSSEIWELSLCLPNSTSILGQVILKHKPLTSPAKRLSFLAHELGKSQTGNLIYANGPAEADKVAQHIYELLGEEENIVENSEIDALIALVRAAVHEKYSLTKVLQRGVAYHYGNMPALIRHEIERLFDTGVIRFLVCTSTLIEGVNLACKNIFVRGPKKGQRTKMSKQDFWNLAGRAGRWGKDFQGNIICIDTENAELWDGAPPRKREQYKITLAADKALEPSTEILEYLLSGMPVLNAYSPSNIKVMEQVVAYLQTTMMKGHELSDISIARRADPALIAEIEVALQNLNKNIEIPAEVAERHPGISPMGMQRLLNYFKNRDKPIEDLIPLGSEAKDAFSSYVKILQRVNAHLAPVFGKGARPVYLADMIVRWMRGQPLHRIIQSRIDWLIDRDKTFDLQTVIRDVMNEVEEIGRFQAPKYIACYVDILRIHLKNTDKSAMMNNEPLNLYLEFGVPGGTLLSLIGLGLSRTSALAIFEYMIDTNMDETSILAWFKENSLDEFKLPVLVRREIEICLKQWIGIF